MTIPYERTRAVLQTKLFLEELQDPRKTPGISEEIRYRAKALLRHYPEYYHLREAHRVLPVYFGPRERDGEPEA